MPGNLVGAPCRFALARTGPLMSQGFGNGGERLHQSGTGRHYGGPELEPLLCSGGDESRANRLSLRFQGRLQFSGETGIVRAGPGRW